MRRGDCMEGSDEEDRVTPDLIGKTGFVRSDG
jgi:hypothetical protein